VPTHTTTPERTISTTQSLICFSLNHRNDWVIQYESSLRRKVLEEVAEIHFSAANLYRSASQCYRPLFQITGPGGRGRHGIYPTPSLSRSADHSLIVVRAKPYLSVTAVDADPPKLLRTVMLRGFVGHDNRALKLPPPSFVSVPMKAPVAVT
jgi:hypothetical protein